MNAVDLLILPERPFMAACSETNDPESVSDRGEEIAPHEVGLTTAAVDRIWQAVQSLYRTRLYPAIQICIRHRSQVVMNRAVGFASGTAPNDPPDARRIPVRVDTPFLLYSASKAMAAMLIHKLDERNELHLDDRVCETIPEFASHGKDWITVRHVLGHRAGIPNLPPEAMDLELLQNPEAVVELLCELEPTSVAGRRLAYHAISGGFVLGEIIRRVTGQDARALMQKEIVEPLGFRWMNFGVEPADVPEVARDALTGLPVLPPFSWALERALGVAFDKVVEKANDPRFLTGVVPAANVVSTAEELCAWYECLLQGGELNGVRVFDPRTIRHATSEQTYLELDLTLGLPLRYGLGFMLGGERIGLFGAETPHAFGHLGFTNILSWADPDRHLSVAIVTSGKCFLNLGTVMLINLLMQIGRAFPRH